MRRSRVYRAGRLESENFAPEELAGYLADHDAVVWVDFAAPTEADLAEVSSALGLHPIAVRDAVKHHQRPKFNHYQGHGLLIAYTTEVTAKTGTLHGHELAIFVTDRALITVCKDDTMTMDGVVERWDADPDLAVNGVGFLLYGVLDYVVNSHLDALVQLDDHVEALEDAVFTEAPTSEKMQRRSMRMHKSLGGMRRKVSPMHDIVTTVMRRENPVMTEQMLPYYQDVLDHVLYSNEQVESLRDLVATIHDTQLNLQGNRMNLIMKKVTSWAAIIAVPTAVTGFYGQNLPFPGSGSHWGVLTSVALIASLSGLLYLMFKRKDWL